MIYFFYFLFINFFHFERGFGHTSFQNIPLIISIDDVKLLELFLTG